MGTSKSSIDPSIGSTARPPGNREYASMNLPHENSDEIRDEIASTRDRMDDTLDELGNRLSPRRLIDDAINLLSSTGTRDTAAKAGESVLVFSENLGRAVRDNPVPTLLIGAGLAWLALGSGAKDRGASQTHRLRREQFGRERYSPRSDDEGFYRGRQVYGLDEDAFLDEDYAELDDEVWAELDDSDLMSPEGSLGDEADTESVAERAKRTATQTAEGAKNAAASVGEAVAHTISGIGDSVKDAANATASAVSSAASTVTSSLSGSGEVIAAAARKSVRQSRRLGSQAYRYGGTASSGISRSLHESQEQMNDLWRMASRRYALATDSYPLAVGMGCLALGMLTGLVVPRTQSEDEWMGSAADGLKEDIRETSEQAVARGKEIASGAVSEVTKSADEHGLSGSGLLERGERVLSKAMTAASEALEEEHLTPRELANEVKQVASEASEKIRSEVTHLGDEAKEAAGKVDPDLKRTAESKFASTPSASSSQSSASSSQSKEQA
jgi:gas vesicle protein